MKHYNIPVFVPHNGCPNDCSFCNQKKITGKQSIPSPDAIKEEIEGYLKTFIYPSDVQIAFFGGSFTGIEESEQIKLLEIAGGYIKTGKVQGIRISTRPDYITPHILNYLKEYKVTSIELGVQSMDDDVLLKNLRGHTAKDVENAVSLIKEQGCFELGLQQMLGLYGSTYESDVDSAQKIAKLKPDVTRIYPTIVLPGTTLYTLMEEGKYAPYTLEEAVDVGSKVYKIYTENGIKVIRMGLQATDIINEQGEISGPYHSSYGELVKSRIIRDEIEKKLISDDITIIANPKLISKITGNKKENIKYFEKERGVTITIVENDHEEYYRIIPTENVK